MPDWTKEKFWKRPTFDHAATGDDQPDAVYLQVGKALTSWERLEEDIGSLFTVLNLRRQCRKPCFDRTPIRQNRVVLKSARDG